MQIYLMNRIHCRYKIQYNISYTPIFWLFIGEMELTGHLRAVVSVQDISPPRHQRAPLRVYRANTELSTRANVSSWFSDGSLYKNLLPVFEERSLKVHVRETLREH